MCGIVGYIGNRKSKNIILKGLKRLEYRGYDSAGFVFLSEKNNVLTCVKSIGDIKALKEKLNKFSKEIFNVNDDGTVGLGHTRWATHGVVNELNAHPHLNCDKDIAIVHNGIIESHSELARMLKEHGHNLISTTDSEVIVHLFSELLKELDLKSALLKLVSMLNGAYAFVLISQKFPDQIVLVRKKSPLVFGVGSGEMFVASDFLAFSDWTDQVVFMPEESIAILNRDSFEIFDFGGSSLDVNPTLVDTKFSDVSKGDFESFMLKEIYEQKDTIKKTISKFIESKLTLWDKLAVSSGQIKKLKQINLVAAGTSWHAARIAQFFIEFVCKIPAKVYLASEFIYMPFFKEDDSLFIFVSQSGETADTMEALRLVNGFGLSTIALTNVESSSLVREAGGFLHMQAGPEIAVASTKAFSNQVASLYWLAHMISLEMGLIKAEEVELAENNVISVANTLESSIDIYKNKIINELAPFYSKYEKFIFLGRHISYPFAMESALKLKEISYIFAQSYPAGELKHGPIALIDEKTPVVVFSVLDNLIYKKIVSNAQEVKARGGHLLVFAFEGQDELIKLADHVFVFPIVDPLLVPLAMTGVMQFFIYQITKELGCPVDRPRNLAKSVTVE